MFNRPAADVADAEDAGPTRLEPQRRVLDALQPGYRNLAALDTGEADWSVTADLRAVPTQRARGVNTVWMEVEEKLGGWARGQLLLMRLSVWISTCAKAGTARS